MKIRHFSLLSILLLAIALFAASMSAWAAPEVQLDATLVAAYWCNMTGNACTDSNNTGQFIRVQASLGAATSAGIVRFDVSTAGAGGWSIDKARLNLALGYTGSCLVENVDIKVYGTANNDADPPQRGNFLASVDGGQAKVPFTVGTHDLSEAYQHWTDTTPADGLVQYLEQQRVADGVATLWVEQTAGTGSIYFDGGSGVLDSGCGAGAGGSYNLGAPVLQLADTSAPLVISMRNFKAGGPAVNPAIWAGLLVGLAVVAGLMAARQRSSQA